MEEFGSITFLHRGYFSRVHLRAIEHFSKLAGEIEDSHSGQPHFYIEHRMYVINSLLSASAFLEAAINEVYQDAYDKHITYLESLDPKVIATLADFWEMTEQDNKRILSTLDKYQLALRFVGKEPFRKGENPYKDASIVIKLRNFLTHYKPKSLGGDQIHSLEKYLKGKFPENKTMISSGNPYFPDKALGRGCTEWAYKSVRNFADSFFERMVISPAYQQGNFK